MARRARNPLSLPPATASLRGYFSGPDSPPDDVPAELRNLPPGQHEILLDGLPWRAAVAENNGQRFLILFDEARQQRRERRFLAYLLAAAGLMALLAALGGWWLAGRVIAPVTELAHAVARAAPESPPQLAGVAAGAGAGDEIDELARAFDRYVARLDAFVERERNFAADASHELRTPLAVIRGAAEVLADDPGLDLPQRDRIARIQRAAEEMTQLTAALLLLSREEAATDTETCDGARLAAECVERYRPQAAARNTRISIESPTSLPLPAPPGLFAMVLTNLVQNAVAHTRDGEIHLRLDHAGLTVRDTGSGMDENALQRVFERHYRGADSQGSGIGLFLVKRICDRLGWQVALQSNPAQGTTAALQFAGP